MLQAIKNLIQGPVEKPTQDLLRSFERRRDHTPDLATISLKTHHLLFVYNEMKFHFPNNYMLQGSELISKGFTKEHDFALWTKQYDKAFPVAAVAVKTCKKPDMRFDPWNPDPARIKGELHLVSSEVLVNLDEAMANGVYFERRPVKIDLPGTLSRWKKVRGMLIRDEFPRYVHSWMYVGDPRWIEEERRSALKPLPLFTPFIREHNKKFVNLRPYYELTKRELIE